MTLEPKRKALIGIGAGLGLDAISALLAFSGDQHFLFAACVLLAATLLFIWGCTHYALSKGLPDWLGYAGLFGIFGFFVIFLFPIRQKNRA